MSRGLDRRRGRRAVGGGSEGGRGRQGRVRTRSSSTNRDHQWAAAESVSRELGQECVDGSGTLAHRPRGSMNEEPGGAPLQRAARAKKLASAPPRPAVSFDNGEQKRPLTSRRGEMRLLGEPLRWTGRPCPFARNPRRPLHHPRQSSPRPTNTRLRHRGDNTAPACRARLALCCRGLPRDADCCERGPNCAGSIG